MIDKGNIYKDVHSRNGNCVDLHLMALHSYLPNEGNISATNIWSSSTIRFLSCFTHKHGRTSFWYYRIILSMIPYYSRRIWYTIRITWSSPFGKGPQLVALRNIMVFDHHQLRLLVAVDNSRNEYYIFVNTIYIFENLHIPRRNGALSLTKTICASKPYWSFLN